MIVLRWLFALPIIVVCVFWALSNRHDISITYSPLHEPIDLPLYFFGLCVLAIGFLFGAFSAWIGSANTRKQRRQYKKDVKRLEKELKTKDNELYKTAIEHINDPSAAKSAAKKVLIEDQ